ncbi:protein DCL, chloroplastic [Aristolochia californica]|uniref:protein DCL, chloroplastic n=1 Tax=Aristolochia californica TaxID=171875 RepID=UPI0035DBB708
MAYSLSLLKQIPFFALRCPVPRATSRCILLFFSPTRRASSETSLPRDNVAPAAATADSAATWGDKDPLNFSRSEHPDYRRWKDREEEILKDIEPVTFLAKEIIHSKKYMDGERLTDEDEKVVLENLLAYHPHAEDKIGSGLDYIMVDRHPQFMNSRCLFVVRTDGIWIDFSYQKCLRAYIREKYPNYAERFIREHFKRSSG